MISGGHGVHTAGIIGAAGNNGVGVTGVAQNVRIMPLRVCSNYVSGEHNENNDVSCPSSSIIAAINYAGDRGAQVANLSLGGTTRSQTEINAIAAHPRTLYVIAAANDSANNDSGGSGTAGHHYPCDYRPAVESSPVVPGAIENTICVAALDPSEALASYSDYGVTSVDIGAPGTAVLSTYPATQTLLSDSFETNNFSSKWRTFGSGFGRAGVGDGPLTSFGITDTPGTAPLANHIYGVELASPISVPSGTGSCQLSGLRYRKGGSLPYGIFDNGSERSYSGGETTGSTMVPFHTVAITGLGGHSVVPFFEYRAGSAPSAAEGAWLDDITFGCNAPLSVPPTWAYDDGTSMATPMVSGAAALLFSLDPAASVAQVRSALLATAKPTASLVGKTVTGGRLDVAAAMNQLVPGQGSPGATPPPSGPTGTAGGTPPPAAGTKAAPASAGCTVPKLAGKSLGAAKAVLGAAKCELGKVSSPKVRRGKKPPKLVVKSSTPAAGAKTSGAVNVTLAPAKKKPKRHHH